MSVRHGMGSDIKVPPPPPHSKRVQAWVYAILNPGIEAVRRELAFLSKGNLTWRFYSRKCEYIRPFVEYTEPSQLPNFEDFLRDSLNSGFAQRIDAHDHAVLQAEAGATRFFDGLMQSELFSKQVADALVAYRSRAQESSLYPDADLLERDLPKYVAEYSINSVDLLPSHYRTHKFWEEFRMEFEPYRLQESFQVLNRSVEDIDHISEDFLDSLERHRYMLCGTYDIPAAPVFADITQSADPYVTRNR